jgi:predicted nucleic acid-binding protein
MNSLVCIDANLVLRTLVAGSFSDKALALWETWQEQDDILVAPTLLAFEVTSSLRRLVYLGEITASEGEEAFRRFLQMDIRLSSQRGIIPLAWELAKQFDRPRAYDTSYLALAQLRGCEFWTADEKLYNAIRHKLTWVRWLGDFNPRKAD